ncbi:MAG: hypothetical protein KatS3mg103_0168 [Phycisphaerales bacterium]|nr:MAG: hypothetical protein KatS3mg103_0168 [Phycisphaerales bacterium]
MQLMHPASPSDPADLHPAPWPATGRVPLQPHEPVPTTPGRIALLISCAGLLTFGVLSPLGLLASLLALLTRPDRYALVGLLLGAVGVAVWVDIIFFGGVLCLMVLGAFRGP